MVLVELYLPYKGDKTPFKEFEGCFSCSRKRSSAMEAQASSENGQNR